MNVNREDTHTNEMNSIDDIPTEDIKLKWFILEYLAVKLTKVREELIGHESRVKSYDPLLIERDGYCHSYAFDLEDGGRHHTFRDLKHLETMMMSEIIMDIKVNTE